MNDISPQEHAVELLQQLGLKEYEARAFVALTRRKRGTAKEISETSDVPRTRVYDAIRVLESKGLVETQHTNPQVFRAVPIDEAVASLEAEYRERTESLRKSLGSLEVVDTDASEDVTHEVWALSGGQGITSRTRRLIDEAEQECVLIIGHENVFTDRLASRLRAAHERGVDVVVGTITEDLRDTVRDALPDVESFVSGLEWLRQSALPGDETEISRLLLVDGETILVSSFTASMDGRTHEKGVFGRGFDNGLVTIIRRLMATGPTDIGRDS